MNDDAAELPVEHAAAEQVAGQDLPKKNMYRFLVPAAIVSALAIAFFAWGFTLQWLVPTLGIMVTLVLLAAMVIFSFTMPDGRERNRTLTILAIALVVAVAACALGFYLVEAAQFPGQPDAPQ